MTRERMQGLVVGLVVVVFVASALGYLLVPSAMLRIGGIGGAPTVDFLVRTPPAAQRGVPVGLATYLFASSLVDLHAFVNDVVGVAAVPSIAVRAVLGAVVVWLIPARDGPPA